MKDDFKYVIAKVSQTIQVYTYPLLRVDANMLPELIASCLFLEVGKSIYLVTAAHALKDYGSGLLTRGNGRLIDVVGRATVSRSEGKDHFDIAAVCIDDKIILEHEIRVIPQAMLISSVEITNPHSRAICGYPISMNKRGLDRKTKTFNAKCYTYFGYAEYEGDFIKFKKSSDTHVGLEYGPGNDDMGRFLSSPPWPPHGISGGGAWLVPDLSCPHLVFLEGIFIEAYKHARKMFCFSTQLEHVIDFINQTHNS